MSAKLKQAMLQPAGPTDIFGVAYLQLCQISYALPSSIPYLVSNKMPPLSADGRWECVWGPAESDDLANLVFVAAYYDGPGLPPTFAAVVTRGTDVDVDDFWGVLQQAFEDFYVIFQSTPPWLPVDSSALVADGTVYALETIQDFTSNGASLSAFLADFLQSPQNDNPVLVCTGHSLGGCVTTVLAPSLQASLAAVGVNNPIVPATFAALTAGNSAFADYYTSTFSYCPRYYNTLDVAPLAWGNLDAVSTIYDCCGIPIPDAAYIALVLWHDSLLLEGASYLQQQANNAPLPGTCFELYPADWYTQAFMQHHTGTYMRLLGGTSIDIGPSLAARSRPRRRVSRYRLLSQVRSRENLLLKSQKG